MNDYLIALIILLILILVWYREGFYPFPSLLIHNIYRSDPAFDNRDERYRGGAHEIPDPLGWQCQSDPLYKYCPAHDKWEITCDQIHKANCPHTESVYAPAQPGFAARNYDGKLLN